MNNEIRNQLLLILSLETGNKENHKMNLEWLLDRYQYDIEDKLKDLEYKKKELEDNLELLKYVREEIKKGEERNEGI